MGGTNPSIRANLPLWDGESPIHYLQSGSASTSLGSIDCENLPLSSESSAPYSFSLHWLLYSGGAISAPLQIPPQPLPGRPCGSSGVMSSDSMAGRSERTAGTCSVALRSMSASPFPLVAQPATN